MVDAPNPKSHLHQYSIADFLQWHSRKELTLNPDFQRRSVWSPDAKSYLIDTILQGYSIPKIYLRTTINPTNFTSNRDVVDGQQRLRTIIEFSQNKFALNSRGREFQRFRYQDLPSEYQNAFLSYPISVEHLVNASDELVLETFSRLNSYTVPLNPAERRHATHNTELKWFVRALSDEFRWFLKKYEISTTKKMLRMDDDVFFAEIVNLLRYGIVDGGAKALDFLYKNNRGQLDLEEQWHSIIGESLSWMDSVIGPVLTQTPLSSSYQVLMIFAAYVHQVHGIPQGKLEELPVRGSFREEDEIRLNLGRLAESIETRDPASSSPEFISALGATTRWKSRSIRFLAFTEAISKD